VGDGATQHEFVSFLSDYGTRDEFVGVCKAVMLELAPHLHIVDITHDVAPFDVRAGALTLVRAIQYLPSGIVLAIVDPGVGTDRRAIAVEVDNGVLVGPDNGLLAPSVAMLGGARRAVELSNPEYQLQAPGGTFAGRDVMAPAAGHLAAGVPLLELGDEMDPAALVPGLLPLPTERDDGTIEGEVLWIDRFGNAQLNVDPDMLSARGVAIGDGVEARIRDEGRRTRWVTTYADARPSEVVLVTDSYGLLSLAIDRQSAAAVVDLRVGTKVVLAPEHAGPTTGGQARVELGRKA
jgi:S-adenosyl-L-methionine hydrolase (adenosine-forming)